MDCLNQRSLAKVASPHSIKYAMFFSVIFRLYDNKPRLNLNRLALYTAGKEITKAIINKMRIADQLFPYVKEELFEDIAGESYRVGS